MNNKITEKKNIRISNQQKEKLVDYMSANLEFARGQFGGINSNINAKEQWEQLQKMLNALGGSAKSIEQWKKCWADLKAGVKKHANVRRAIMNRTGGGSWSEVPRDLNSLEEKILSVMSIDAIDGDSRTIESGFEAVIPEETIISTENLEDDLPPPAKVCKIESPLVPKTSSKYKETLDEAKKMTQIVMKKLEKVEQQNIEIARKMESMEKTLNNILSSLQCILPVNDVI